MEILSASLENATIEKIEKIKSNLGIKSRSKIIAKAIDSLEREFSVLEKLKGQSKAVLSIAYDSHENEGLKDFTEEFEDIIRTELHQHSEGICIRVLIVGGDAERLKKLFKSLKAKNEIKSVSINLI